MKIRLLVRTPKGQAKKAEGTLKTVLGVKRNYNTYTNDEDNEIAFIIEDDSRRCFKIIDNAYKFHLLAREIGSRVVKNKIVGYATKLTQEQKEEFLDMLNRQTEVEYIKEATAEELARDNKSVFAKIKEKLGFT